MITDNEAVRLLAVAEENLEKGKEALKKGEKPPPHQEFAQEDIDKLEKLGVHA